VRSISEALMSCFFSRTVGICDCGVNDGTEGQISM